MPTLLIEKGIRYFFYSNENNEPCHVHVEKGEADGKIWLEPAIKVEEMYGFTNAEAKGVLNCVAANYETFKGNGMTSLNKYDSIEQIIYDTGLRISKVGFDKQNGLIIIGLNSGKFLFSSLSAHKLLAGASEEQLTNYRLIANGVGIHWPKLDEDLSLKGFFKAELKQLVTV